MTGVTNTFPPGHTRATVGSGHNSVTVSKTSLFSLSLPTHAYRLEISPCWQWSDLASIRTPHLSIVTL